MNALLTANVVIVAILAWVSLFKVVPDCATSSFRYRLWRLRDQLVDEIRAREFDEVEPPKRLVAFIEAAIEQAADVSALNLILLQMATRDIDVADPLPLDGLSERDVARLEERRTEFEHAMLIKTFLGSPSGWLLSLLVLPPAAVLAGFGRLVRGGRDGRSLLDDTKQQVFEEFELNPARALMKRGHTPGDSLHQHV